MAHRTLINGTGYNVKKGRTLSEGTGYAIQKGRTLIGGTGYDIRLNQYTFTQMKDNYIGDSAKSVTWERTADGLVCTAVVSLSSSENNRLNCGYYINGLQPGDKMDVVWSLNTTPSGNFYIDGVINDASRRLAIRTEGYTRESISVELTAGNVLAVFAAIGRTGTHTTRLIIHSIKVNGEEILN